ncbi:hypothetical protein MMYC01_200062 [Madurella mycetomatis]|uniref:FAD-binding FR-type domain-containing protein n=1 Tax=Madurella mycetomatis TaxID=100816 RepID=A0A150ATS9_9PEZI|nr:hypothetical protein MMYC01_200062 [Madurella mycetomatis]
MATLLEQSHDWHPGEKAIHSLLRVPTSNQENPTSPGLPPSYAYRVKVSPLLAVGALDDQGQPWTSVWGGMRGFARRVAEGVLGMQSVVDRAHDPVVKALLGRAAEGEVIQPVESNMMSALSIDLETRDRVKLAGKMVVGTVAGRPDGDAIGEIQVGMLVEESLGNCPKYLNKKMIRAHIPSPKLVSSSLPLSAEALALIEKADMFFLTSTNGQTMDTNHRGGPAGFVRVVNNSTPEDGGGVVLVYPEFSGNRLYQTLGNLHTNPRVGIAIPDYDSSDVLYLTGETELLVRSSAAALMPHTKLAVKITVHKALFIKDSLPFRGSPGEPSPYNPPVRRLATEGPSHLPSQPPTSPLATAILLRKEPITPTIARFTLSLQPPQTGDGNNRPGLTWVAGQHITLDFEGELDLGWSHMNDADPQSLNDDFIRTFTISNPPPRPPPPPASSSSPSPTDKDGAEVHIQLTLRKHGPATGLLFSRPIRHDFAALEIPVLAIGGGGGEEGRFRIPLPADDDDDDDNGLPLEVLWSLRAADLPLAVDSFERIVGLGAVTKVFVTALDGVDGGNDGAEEEEMVGKLTGMGVRVERRRMSREDVLSGGGDQRRYFVCASGKMQEAVLGWLEGEDVAVESFAY